MKNTFKLFGIIAIVAVIGFLATACTDDSGNGLNSGNSGNEGNSDNGGNGGGGGNGSNGGGGIVNLFIGIWRASYAGYTHTIIFNANLTFSTSVNGSTANGTYSYNGKTATLSIGGTIWRTATLNNNGSSFTFYSGGDAFYKQ